MAKVIKKLVRVGEKNNFNFTQKEKDSLETFKKDGLDFFVNSNSKVTIDNSLPSIVTINPDLDTFIAPKGDLRNVKALRIKVYTSCLENRALWDCIQFANRVEIPVLITFMRFRSKASFSKFTGYDVKKQSDYVFDHNYFRPTKSTQMLLIEVVKALTTVKVYTCDENGTGCPDCGNCAALNGYSNETPVVSLNLSVSGKEDKNGKCGICKFDCPDCWAKIVTFGKSPSCDKIIQNRKQRGLTKHI